MTLPLARSSSDGWRNRFDQQVLTAHEVFSGLRVKKLWRGVSCVMVFLTRSCEYFARRVEVHQ